MADYDTAALRAPAGAPASGGASRGPSRAAAHALTSPATLERERCNWKGCR
jgi:hypothetical protein